MNDEDEQPTMRDFFAAFVVGHIVSNQGLAFGSPEDAAERAYLVADAMLKVRKEPQTI